MITSFGSKVEKVVDVISASPKQMLQLNSRDVVSMCETWARIEVPNEQEFYYRAGSETVSGVILYYIEQSGLIVKSNLGSPDITCIIHVLDGVVTRQIGSEKHTYTPNSGQQTFWFNSAEDTTITHFESVIWMLPIVRPKCNKSQKALGANLVDEFSFAEIVAFSTLPEGPGFISRLLTEHEISKVDERYTGVYSKIFSCLAHRQFTLAEIAYATGLPASTLSKFHVGNMPIMEFVRSYRRAQIRTKLRHIKPDVLAREEGFSSKYKMFDFLNRDNKNQISVEV